MVGPVTRIPSPTEIDMTAAQAISQLQALPPNEHIVLAYWRREAFPEIPPDQWDAASDHATHETDWSRAHEAIDWEMTQFLQS
jgi:hypothetical protein